MERKKLKKLHFEFLALKILQNISFEELLDWIGDFLEFDAYYAGLALSVSEGGSVSINDLHDLNKLNEAFMVIYSKGDSNREVLEACKIISKKSLRLILF